MRFLMANRRATVTVRSSRLMTTTRSITRAVTVGRTGPFVARFWDPGLAQDLVRVVGSTGRIVAEARATGAAAISISSLRAGRYTIRASTAVALPGLTLRRSAAWFR